MRFPHDEGIDIFGRRRRFFQAHGDGLFGAIRIGRFGVLDGFQKSLLVVLGGFSNPRDPTATFWEGISSSKNTPNYLLRRYLDP